ncbi:jg26341 [Pararge aegeria aegeria]|uniref:Jg26341 protein n=1 Tax=Pararge aegeria aegeria TaxID=348720 RepID=A0A8S4R233_9NEOP|nr:jg26341 [Pararge aegeria aegeria]
MTLDKQPRKAWLLINRVGQKVEVLETARIVRTHLGSLIVGCLGVQKHLLADYKLDNLSTVTKKTVSLSHAQAHNDDGHNGDQDKLASSIKEETDDESEQTQQKETDDVWTYFEKIPSNRARCILCKETFNRHTPFLSKHMTDRHRKVVFVSKYTERVYLYL